MELETGHYWRVVGAESRWEESKEQMQEVETSSMEYSWERVKIISKREADTCLQPEERTTGKKMDRESRVRGL